MLPECLLNYFRIVAVTIPMCPCPEKLKGNIRPVCIQESTSVTDDSRHRKGQRKIKNTCWKTRFYHRDRLPRPDDSEEPE